MTCDASVKDRIFARLQEIYGEQAGTCFPQLVQRMEEFADGSCAYDGRRWDERDLVLITYGDQLSAEGEVPLKTLRRFLVEQELEGVINSVHLLPFFPYTSDDGFSVVDYVAVDPNLGDWQDIEALGKHVDLVFDLVLNHVSQASRWFQGYLAGDEKYADYFIEVDPQEDLSLVTRPRSLPLLTPFETSRGTRHLWTTFSSDQIDLNYAHPAVLLDVLEVLLTYIRRGARFIRLDAIAYLWKQIGTSSIHLPQTHAIVKLMRDVTDAVAPHVVLLTETNVPHRENISYFGAGDEAHMVYQFSLPPLLLDGLLHQDATPLHRWMTQLGDTPAGTTFFNFTASHDGIGVRPLEGLVPHDRLQQLAHTALACGGQVSTKRNPDGTDAPYELNVTYLDALGEPEAENAEGFARRFLASQAVMLAFRGVPGVYFHSLVGTRNDLLGARESGIPRRINRRKFQWAELTRALSDEQALEGVVFAAFRHMADVRIRQRAFHPDGPQTPCSIDDPSILAFFRSSPDRLERILVVANFSDKSKSFNVIGNCSVQVNRDVLSDAVPVDGCISLRPYQVVWLEVTASVD